jgi:hypothetical protein
MVCALTSISLLHFYYQPVQCQDVLLYISVFFISSLTLFTSHVCSSLLICKITSQG